MKSSYPILTSQIRPAIKMSNDRHAVFETQAHRELEKQQRVENELREARLGWYSMLQAEPRMISDALHDWEHVAGAVYGYSPEGFAILVATNLRIIFASHKLLFAHIDELAFKSVSGVSIESVGPYCKLTLHTGVGNYTVRTLNQACARRFASYIELKILEHELTKQGVSS